MLCERLTVRMFVTLPPYTFQATLLNVLFPSLSELFVRAPRGSCEKLANANGPQATQKMQAVSSKKLAPELFLNIAAISLAIGCHILMPFCAKVPRHLGERQRQPRPTQEQPGLPT